MTFLRSEFYLHKYLNFLLLLFICKWIALLQVTISLPWFLKKLRKFGAS